MRPPQLSIKMILWLMVVVAMVLTEWAMIDLVTEASKSGELRIVPLIWMGIACIGALVGLIIFRP